jgi:hypothetical protein
MTLEASDQSSPISPLIEIRSTMFRVTFLRRRS